MAAVSPMTLPPQTTMCPTAIPLGRLSREDDTDRSVEPENALDADGQTGMLADPSDTDEDTWHERLARQRVVPDRERLAVAAQEHFLVRDQAGQSHRVHAY